MSGDRTASFVIGCAAVLLLAVLVHIVSVLALPGMASRDAYSRLSAFAVPGRFALLPAAAPGQEALPFSDPAMAQSICVFDLAAAPLHITADTDDDLLLTLSFRTRGGLVFYAMTDRAALRGKIDLRLLTASQRQAVEANDPDDAPPELRIVPPNTTGFILATALAAFPSERQTAETRVQTVSCTQEPIKPD